MKQLPLTINQIIDSFPDECRELIPRVNRGLKRTLKPYLKHVQSIRDRHYDMFTEQFLIAVIKMEYKPELIEAVIRRNESILAVMDAPKDARGIITGAMIEEAKRIPINTLHNFERVRPGVARWTACCPLHYEKTGSFTVYANNTYYCFGCHEGGDTIAFVRKLYGISFPEAIEMLLNR